MHWDTSVIMHYIIPTSWVLVLLVLLLKARNYSADALLALTPIIRNIFKICKNKWYNQFQVIAQIEKLLKARIKVNRISSYQVFWYMEHIHSMCNTSRIRSALRLLLCDCVTHADITYNASSTIARGVICMSAKVSDTHTKEIYCNFQGETRKTHMEQS